MKTILMPSGCFVRIPQTQTGRDEKFFVQRNSRRGDADSASSRNSMPLEPAYNQSCMSEANAVAFPASQAIGLLLKTVCFTVTTSSHSRGLPCSGHRIRDSQRHVAVATALRHVRLTRWLSFRNALTGCLDLAPRVAHRAPRHRYERARSSLEVFQKTAAASAWRLRSKHDDVLQESGPPNDLV